MNIFELLSYEEGYREKPYYCSEGYPTIGIGTKIGPKGASLALYQFSVNKEVAKAMLDKELLEVVTELHRESWYAGLDKDRAIIIQSMCYQMGCSGVKKFKNMLKALEAQDWEEASKQALDSRWARQTPDRAHRHAHVIEGGSLDDVYGGMI